MQEEIFITCKCTSLDHLARFSLDSDNELFLTVHLAPLSFFKRVRNAFLYIMGKRSTYGDFEEILLTEEAVQKLKLLLERVKL